MTHIILTQDEKLTFFSYVQDTISTGLQSIGAYDSEVGISIFLRISINVQKKNK